MPKVKDKDIFEVVKKKIQPNIYYLAKSSFRIKRERDSFPRKQKLEEFMTN